MSDRLLAAILLLLWGFCLWPLQGTPWGDAPLLLVNAHRLAESLHNLEGLDFARGLLGMAIPQPPAGYLPLILGSLLQDGHARLLGSLVLLLLIGDAWRRILGSYWPLCGLLCSSMLWQYGWEYGWDLVAGAVLLQALSWLPPGFENRRASIVFGVWLGVAALSKYSLPFYLWLPILGALRGLRRENLRNLGWSLGVAVAIALPWALAHLGELAPYVGGSFASDVQRITMNGRSWGERLMNLGYYPLALKDALGWPGMLLLGLGWHQELRRIPQLRLVGLGILGGLASMSLLPAAVDRYALPALVLGMGGVLGLQRLPAGGLLGISVFATLALGSAQSFASGTPSAPPSYQHRLLTLSWPKSVSYRPFLVETSALDRWLTELPEGRGQVGVLLPFDGRLPDVGVMQERAWNLGWRGELLPIRPMPGMLPERDFPPEVHTLLAWIPDEATVQWLEQQGWKRGDGGALWQAAGAQWRMETWRR